MSHRGSVEPALARLQEQVRDANRARLPLHIAGGDTKKKLRNPVVGAELAMSTYGGIVDYTPAELVMVARAGTPLVEIESALSARGQRLAFEPPHTGEGATLGGMLGAGLAGPSRPWTAAVRDHVLGVTLLGPEGDLVRYGGQVMKNVAGYDVPRLMVGAWGSLGPVVEAALRVVPQPAVCRSFAWVCGLEEARAWMRRAGLKPWPVTGLCHDGEALHIRLEGANAAVRAAEKSLPDAAFEESSTFFAALRDLRHEIFRGPGTLWRCVVPASAEPTTPEGKVLWDWGGALRWLRTDAPASDVLASARDLGGTARSFDANFASAGPASGALQALESRLRSAFDPHGIFAGNAAPATA